MYFDDCMKIYSEYPLKGKSLCKEFKQSAASVRKIASDLGVTGPKNVTKQERKILSEYKDIMGSAIVFMLPGRTPKEVEAMLNEEYNDCCDAESTVVQ